MPSRFGTAVLALTIDVAVGEPPARLHPVVLIGKAIDLLGAIEPRAPGPQLVYGVIRVLTVAGGAALVGRAAERRLQRLPWALRAGVAATILKSTLSLRGLAAAGGRLERDLEAGDLGAARLAARALVSRPTDRLGPALLASAGVESIAENAADSVIAPLLYYALGGLPAALGYRAANTLDAMIGYHGRFEYSGKAAARLDDLLNLVPSRLTAGLLVVAAALAGGDVPGAVETLRRDRGATRSPNAGWPMSAMAGALGIRLEKPGAYVLGSPLPPPDTPALDHAVQLLFWTTVLSLPIVYAVCRAADRGAA